MTEEEVRNFIKEKIELLKEYLEYGMEYRDYLDVVNAFQIIEKTLKKQQEEIEKKDKIIQELENKLNGRNVEKR